MRKSRSLKIIVGCAVLLVGLMLTWQSALTQAALLLTATPLPTIQHAPCASESTRTPTLSATRATRTPGATPSATSVNLPFVITLHYPPNCATLHSGTLPTFDFATRGGPFVYSVTVYSRDNDIHLLLTDAEQTPVVLPDGVYYWSVSASRLSGSGGSSETWTFTIDTRCNCTDTPTP
ncbi:MAG: hypothetical protein U0694_21565 [Anaerolineae bacterium]